MRRIVLIAGVAVVSSVLTAAAIVLPASAGGRDDTASRDRIQEFESCMLGHGFELGPETEIVVTPDGVRVNGKAVDAEAFRAAQRDCGPPFRGLLPHFDGELPELDGRLERLRDCSEGREA